VPDGVDFDEFTDSTPFKAVAKIISALSTQDEGIAAEFRLIQAGKQNVGERKIIFEGNVPVGMNLDLSSFADKINAKIWERVGRLNWRPFIEARDFVHSLGIKNSREWNEIYSKSLERPSDIPSAALKRYIGKGWSNWGDWLGTNFVSLHNRRYLPINEAIDFVQKLHINSHEQWRKYSASGERPLNIPARPEIIYKGDGWTGYGDFLGTGIKTTTERVYRSFEDARAFVHTLKLSSYIKWRKYCKSGEIPIDIPKSPLFVYKGKGWLNTGDWLGTGTIVNRATRDSKHLPFDEAKAFVHDLKLKSSTQWIKYTQSGHKPDNIPANPRSKYDGKGWSGWIDWLGTK